MKTVNLLLILAIVLLTEIIIILFYCILTMNFSPKPIAKANFSIYFLDHEPDHNQRWAKLQKLMLNKYKIKINLTRINNFNQALTGIESGGYDILVANAAVYKKLREMKLVKALADEIVSSKNMKLNRSTIIAANTIKNIDDLQGKRCVCPAPWSLNGFLAAVYNIEKHFNQPFEEIAANIKFTLSNSKAVAALKNGSADFAILPNSFINTNYSKIFNSSSLFKNIHNSYPIPGKVMMISCKSIHYNSDILNFSLRKIFEAHTRQPLKMANFKAVNYDFDEYLEKNIVNAKITKLLDKWNKLYESQK